MRTAFIKKASVAVSKMRAFCMVSCGRSSCSDVMHSEAHTNAHKLRIRGLETWAREHEKEERERERGEERGKERGRGRGGEREREREMRERDERGR